MSELIRLNMRLRSGDSGSAVDRAELHDVGAVVHVRQHHVIARRAEPPRHVAQLLADRRRIHVEDDDGKRPAALGMGDEGGGLAVLGLDLNLLVDHGRFFAL